MTLSRASLLTVALFLSCTEDPAEVHKAKGNELYRKNEFAKAAEEYAASLDANPKQDLKAYEKTAYSFMKAGNHDKAAAILLKTVDLQANEEGKLNVYRNIAGMYLQDANEPDNAEKFFEMALKLNPKDEQSLSWMAEIASRRDGARSNTANADLKELDKALALYEQLIGMAPTSSAHLINKRIVLIKYIDALGKLKVAAEKDAEDNKADKQVAEDFKNTAAKYVAQADAMKTTLDETTKKLVEVQKAAKKP